MPASGGDQKTGGKTGKMVSGTAHDKTPMKYAVMGYGAFDGLFGVVRRTAADGSAALVVMGWRERKIGSLLFHSPRATF